MEEEETSGRLVHTEGMARGGAHLKKEFLARRIPPAKKGERCRRRLSSSSSRREYLNGAKGRKRIDGRGLFVTFGPEGGSFSSNLAGGRETSEVTSAMRG